MCLEIYKKYDTDRSNKLLRLDQMAIHISPVRQSDKEVNVYPQSLFGEALRFFYDYPKVLLLLLKYTQASQEGLIISLPQFYETFHVHYLYASTRTLGLRNCVRSKTPSVDTKKPMPPSLRSKFDRV